MIKIKITIDTKEDSKEEIEKAIQLLSHLVKERVRSNTNLFADEPTESAGSAFVNMFGDVPLQAEKTKEPVPVERKEPESGTPINFSGLTNLMSKKEEKDDEPQVISY